MVGLLYPLREQAYSLTHRLEFWLTEVFAWAISMKYIQKADNPVDYEELNPLLPDTQRDKQNFPSMRYQEVEDLLNLVRADGGNSAARLLLEFQALTATRPVEPAGMGWTELHLDHPIFIPKTKGMPPLTWPCWIIPAERYKIRQDMVIPLARQTLGILVQATEFSHLHPYLVFPSDSGNAHVQAPLNIQKRICDECDITDSVPHGIRNTAREFNQEHTVPYEVAETSPRAFHQHA